MYVFSILNITSTMPLATVMIGIVQSCHPITVVYTGKGFSSRVLKNTCNVCLQWSIVQVPSTAVCCVDKTNTIVRSYIARKSHSCYCTCTPHNSCTSHSVSAGEIKSEDHLAASAHLRSASKNSRNTTCVCVYVCCQVLYSYQVCVCVWLFTLISVL